MGTNFYFYPCPPCECCGRPFDSWHIGKSSYGWCFSLHVIPSIGINSLEDWQKKWEIPGSQIGNEYGDIISIIEMNRIITERSHVNKVSWKRKWWTDHYENEEDFHDKNQSERGPHFLLRHRVDGTHCVGQGEGTYDYIAGEFS